MAKDYNTSPFFLKPKQEKAAEAGRLWLYLYYRGEAISPWKP